ncbi:MAG: hypothetical protein JNK58_02000 [Phycisphaerae bacterium]|nr:hypothetical protein [Phycisphaerae bacterium]
MNRTRFTSVLFVASLVVGAGVGATLSAALPPVDYNNPGYQWGRTHCGPSRTTGGKSSIEQCKNCCRSGARDDETFPVDHGAQGGCEAFCDRAMWPIA